jgi:hypothetical protein
MRGGGRAWAGCGAWLSALARAGSIGTAAPQGNGTVRYYDNRGNSLGTSTTSPSGTRTFYGPRGNVTGRAFRSK